MQVLDILRTKGTEVTTAPPGTTLAEAVSLLQDRNIGALVVTEDGATIEGILSERDVVRALATAPSELLASRVDSIMTRSVFTCGPSDRVTDLMSMMTDNRIRHLPVEVDGSLSGIISIGDVVKHRLSELERETRAMAEYIHQGL